ncbi:MAG: pyridoxal phosphate-dependent aminotransferase [Bacillota bacterium]
MVKGLSTKTMGIQPSRTLAIVAKEKKMKAAGIDVISFGAGEPDFKTPENIRQAAIHIIENGNIGYTDASGLPELKEAICRKFEKDNNLFYTPKNIVVSNGAKHSLFSALQAICNPGDEVIIPQPYWVSYPELIKMADAKPVLLDTEEDHGFVYTKEGLEKLINEKTKAIILNSPNNPTGSVFNEEDLNVIAQVAIENNIYVISDEIYEKLVYNRKHISIASLGDDIKNLTIVVNGVSKCYAMTGWRIGYAAANEEITKVMTNIQSHATSNPNTIAQYAAIEALTGKQDTMLKMIKAFDARRRYMADRINKIENISCKEPEGAFYIMLNISNLIGKRINESLINGSMDFADYLLESVNVAVVPGIAFGNDNYVRLSYATSLEKIKEGLNRIENAVKRINPS